MFNMKPNSLYEYSTKSLRESFITISQFVKDVSRVETDNSKMLQISIDNKLMELSNIHNIYTAPYVWDTPCYVEILMDRGCFKSPSEITMRDIQSITDVELHAWINKIGNRVQPYLINAISEDYMNYLDNNPSVGVVLHALTGDLDIINYDMLKSVEFNRYDIMTIVKLIRTYMDIHMQDPEEIRKAELYEEPYNTMSLLLNTFESRLKFPISKPMADICILRYNTDECKDRIDMVDISDFTMFDITSSLYITPEQCDSVEKYINIMTKLRSKLMIIS